MVVKIMVQNSNLFSASLTICVADLCVSVVVYSDILLVQIHFYPSTT